MNGEEKERERESTNLIYSHKLFALAYIKESPFTISPSPYRSRIVCVLCFSFFLVLSFFFAVFSSFFSFSSYYSCLTILILRIVMINAISALPAFPDSSLSSFLLTFFFLSFSLSHFLWSLVFQPSRMGWERKRRVSPKKGKGKRKTKYIYKEER